MRGDRLLILPVQLAGPEGEHLDQELTFALRQAGAPVEVLSADELEDVLAGVGRLGADPRNLPVAAFEVGEVRRVGDPLFGSLYRMAVLTDARFVLLPVSAREGAGQEVCVRSLILNVALVEPRTGRVMWQGIVEGEPGASGSPAAAASVAERVAARLLR